MNKLRQLSYVILLFIAINNDFCEGRISFRRGRQLGGNLGEPSHNDYQLSSLTPSFPDLWFDQILDHFNPFSETLWKQRYFINDEFWKPGGPVFLMIGGEGTASPKWMHQGAWIHYAKKHGALCFQIEHRFYGKSHPTPDISVQNLAYLSSEQALADIANFIQAMKTKHNMTDNNKWIAFGGSYPGSLAAWLREKYPHLVVGAISSSGPLLAKADFIEYYQVVENSLRTHSDACVTSVKKAFNQLDILIRQKLGRRAISDKFSLCTPMENSYNDIMDVTSFYENIADSFAGVVQYNKDNRNSQTAKTIDEICDVINNTTLGPPINRLAEVLTSALKDDNKLCLDFKYDESIRNISKISWDSEEAEGGRQWTYQTCTEFGFYQTSEEKDSIFSDTLPLNYYVQQCTDIFGSRFTADFLNKVIDRTNNNYGALNPATTNVLFVHGSIDPWHALGLTNSTNKQLPTIFIEGTAHCANMYEPSEHDLPQLTEARKKICAFIGSLLESE